MLVEDYLYELEGEQRVIAMYLHDLLISDLGLSPKIRYRIPFYFGRSWVCYVNTLKGDKIELAFLRGYELSNEQGLLQDKGRKQISGIEIEKLSNAPLEAIYEVIQEAMMLDETSNYQVRGKKNKGL